MKCALLSAMRTWLPDSNGKPLAGHCLRFFDQDTTDPADVYSGPGDEIDPQTVSLGPEVQLDASGFAPMGGIWLDIDKKYRMEVAKFIDEDPATGERRYQTLWTIEWLPGITENLRFDVADSGTVEALGLAPDTDNAFMCVGGYYRKGDGGGGVFYWDAEATDTPDNGMTFAPNPGSAGRWKRILQGRILHSAFYGAHAHIDENSGASAVVISRWNAMMNFASANRLTVHADCSDGTDTLGHLFRMKFLAGAIRTDVPTILDSGAIFDDYSGFSAVPEFAINDANLHFDCFSPNANLNFGSRAIRTSWFNSQIGLSKLQSYSSRIIVDTDNPGLVNSALTVTAEIRSEASLNMNGNTLTFNARPAVSGASVAVNGTIAIGYADDCIRLTDWFAKSSDAVAVTDSTFVYKPRFIADMKCNFALGQPGMILNVAAPCAVSGDSSLYNVLFSEGAKLDFASGKSLTLNAPAVTVDSGNLSDATKCGSIRFGSNVAYVEYSGNIALSSFDGPQNLRFEKATINTSGTLAFPASQLIEMRDTAIVSDAIIIAGGATMTWTRVKKMRHSAGAVDSLLKTASPQTSLPVRFVAVDSIMRTNGLQHIQENDLPDNSCLLIDNCQFDDLDLDLWHNYGSYVIARNSTLNCLRALSINNASEPLTLKNVEITGCRFKYTVLLNVNIPVLINVRITGNDFASAPAFYSSRQYSWYNASMLLVRSSSEFDMYDNTLNGQAANIPATRMSWPEIAGLSSGISSGGTVYALKLDNLIRSAKIANPGDNTAIHIFPVKAAVRFANPFTLNAAKFEFRIFEEESGSADPYTIFGKVVAFEGGTEHNVPLSALECCLIGVTTNREELEWLISRE